MQVYTTAEFCIGLMLLARGSHVLLQHCSATLAAATAPLQQPQQCHGTNGGRKFNACAALCVVNFTPCRFLALPHLQVFELDFSDLFGAPNPAAWSAVLAYTLVMVFDIGGAMFGLGSLAGRCAFCSRTRRSSIGGQQLMWSLLQHLQHAAGPPPAGQLSCAP
eukprot:GHRQ01020479.1.p2 GENE.GHRQ01020479.1~~GHRQ01020479.1.p2  ORF type:complete len:163 (-),score=44.15 GHRQ01020479.1:491-979(-)